VAAETLRSTARWVRKALSWSALKWDDVSVWAKERNCWPILDRQSPYGATDAEVE
jgi:hypothetical protein